MIAIGDCVRQGEASLGIELGDWEENFIREQLASLRTEQLLGFPVLHSISGGESVPSSLSDLAKFSQKSSFSDHQNTCAKNQNAPYRILERRI